MGVNTSITKRVLAIGLWGVLVFASLWPIGSNATINNGGPSERKWSLVSLAIGVALGNNPLFLTTAFRVTAILFLAAAGVFLLVRFTRSAYGSTINPERRSTQ